MNIAVVLKQVPDLVEGLEIDTSGKAVDPSSVRYILSESDDHALEEALIIKEQVGGRVEVYSLDTGEAQEAMVAALAKGADHAVKANAGLESAPDNHTAARVFASIFRDKHFDLILTGVRAIDDLDGSLGGLIAAFLDLPYVGLIRKVQVAAGGTAAIIEKEYPGGCAAELAVTPPAVLGVQAAEHPPRYVPITRLRQMMKTACVEELVVPPATAQPMGIVRMFKPEEGAGAKLLTGSLEEISRQVTGLIAEKHLLR